MLHSDNLHWASMDSLRRCTALSPPDLIGDEVRLCRIASDLLARSRPCTTLSSLDLNGAPHSPVVGDHNWMNKGAVMCERTRLEKIA